MVIYCYDANWKKNNTFMKFYMNNSSYSEMAPPSFKCYTPKVSILKVLKLNKKRGS